jgi:hypothetical protein
MAPIDGFRTEDDRQTGSDPITVHVPISVDCIPRDGEIQDAPESLPVRTTFALLKETLRLPRGDHLSCRNHQVLVQAGSVPSLVVSRAALNEAGRRMGNVETRVVLS